MADLDYLFSHLYGFEPYLDNAGAGGASLTSHNLVVTLWSGSVDIEDPNSIAVFGSLLKPVSQNDNIDPVKRAAGAQAFSSRCSAEFFFENVPEGEEPINQVIAVANPPPEMRQQLAGAVQYNGGNPALLSSYTVSKSLQSCYLWTTELWDSGGFSENYFDSQASTYYVGTYLPLGDYTGVEATSVPFLKKSGADGQTPEFFDRTTVQGVQEMIAAINAGDFFVPLFIDFNGSAHVHAKIMWPHSVARG